MTGELELVETRKSAFLPTLRPPRQDSSVCFLVALTRLLQCCIRPFLTVHVPQANAVKTEMEKRLTEAGLDTHVLHKHDADTVTLLLGSLSQEQEIYHAALTDVIKSLANTNPSQAKLLVDVRDNYQLLFAKVPQQVHKITADLGLERDLNAELLSELRRARRAIKECSNEMEMLMESIAPTKSGETQIGAASTTADPTSAESTPATNRFLSEIDSATAEESQSATQLIHHLEHLYEMQRTRMEQELSSANNLTDMWITAADKLSQLVGDESTVDTISATRLTANCWLETARKIMSTVQARDADLSGRIELHVGEWKTHLVSINRMSQKSREVGLLALRSILRDVSVGCMEATWITTSLISECPLQVKNMVKEQSVVTGQGDKTRAWNKTMVMAERWVATLDKRQSHLTGLTPKGGVDRLERLCTSWSELGDILFRYMSASWRCTRLSVV